MACCLQPVDPCLLYQDVSRFRSFIRHSLNEGKLAEAIRVMLKDKALLTYELLGLCLLWGLRCVQSTVLMSLDLSPVITEPIFFWWTQGMHHLMLILVSLLAIPYVHSSQLLVRRLVAAQR